MRDYGNTNAAPYASAPTVGLAGDTYFNTTDKRVYVSDGTTWIPAGQWTVSGAALTPTDTTKQTVLLGTATAKARLSTGGAGTSGIGITSNQNWAAGTNAQDDATKPSWGLLVGATDTVTVQRSPAGSTTQTNVLSLDGTGLLIIGTTGGRFVNQSAMFLSTSGVTADLTTNDPASPGYNSTLPSWMLRLQHSGGDAFSLSHRVGGAGASYSSTPLSVDASGNLTIAGPTGTKSAGTTWANPSDPRLKDDIAPYPRGLADILPLEPITYRLKSDGSRCIGFDASEVKKTFPECVSETQAVLPGDTEPTDGVLSFDMHPILVALVTAVKELTARVAALEATTGGPDPTPA